MGQMRSRGCDAAAKIDTTKVAEPPDGGPPASGLPWILYAITAVAAVLAILDFAIGVSGHRDHLSGGWLFWAMTVPIVVLGSIVGYQAWRFGAGLKLVASTFASELSTQVQTSTEMIDGLRTELDNEHSYVELVRGVSTAARDLSRQVMEHNAPLKNDQLGLLLRRACKDVARSYSTSIGEQARVCVKQLTEAKQPQPTQAYVQTVCRSDGLTDEDPTRRDPVEGNTDFDVLFNHREDYWFSSNIDEYPGYQNSSRRPWSYKSVIVWPIIARTGRADVQSQSNGYDVAAFLCLDARSTSAFDEERDVPLGWAMADAMGKAYEAHYLTFV